MNLILVKEKYETPKPMFNQCPLCYNSKTSEKFLMSLESTKREHRSNMDQHGIIYNDYEIINMIWNNKQADISKGHSYFMTKFPTLQETNQLISRENQLVDLCMIRTSTMK